MEVFRDKPSFLTTGETFSAFVCWVERQNGLDLEKMSEEYVSEVYRLFLSQCKKLGSIPWDEEIEDFIK